MWDQKSSTDSQSISVSGRSAAAAAEDNKKQFQSNINQDSGFLSGPISSQFSSEIDDDQQRNDDVDISDDPPQPKKVEASAAKQARYSDSGAIDDFIDDEAEEDEEKKMILDSGVDSGLEQWFCCMNLKNSTEPLNNLGAASAATCHKAMLEAAAMQQRFPKISAKLQHQLQQQPLWEICYIQDNDGDT